MMRNERTQQRNPGGQDSTHHKQLSITIRIVVALAVAVSLLPITPVFTVEPAAAQEVFSFALTADMRQYAGSGTYDASSYFRGAMEAIDLVGEGAFMISPGDIDPPDSVNWTIEQVLGTAYLWYPVVGNHEEETASDMAWLRAFDYDQNGAGNPPDIVNVGPAACPETTYSFDYGNVHFAVLNQYCDSAGDDVTSGDVPDYLYNWLVADLQATTKEHLIVIGHEPAYPQPDADNGRVRHLGDSLDQYPANRDRFWELLKTEGVVAYLCGHTPNYSAVKIDGVWQLDAGHSRGIGDTGAASTFIMVHVDGDTVAFDTYRDVHDGAYDYDDIIHSGTLTGGTDVTLVSKGNTWKYLDNGSDQATAWQVLAFDDGAWSSGPAELGYGDGGEATVVSYGPNASNKYITTYFRRVFTIADASQFASLMLGVVRDDGAVVYLNGAEVYRTNMPGTSVKYLTTATTALGGAGESSMVYAAVDPALLSSGPNVLAVEIHQANVTSSDISFDLELVGTLEAPTLPADPSGLAATAVSGSQIDLSWTDNSDDEDGFQIEQSPDAGNWALLDTVGADVTTYSHTGLPAGTTIYYQVSAYNDAGSSGYSNVDGATTHDDPPSVSITSPPQGATVSDSIVITADASDDVAVAQVEFFVDSASIGSDSDGTDGWSYPWDTTGASDGSHTLGATATDSADQTASDAIGVTVDNADITPPAPPVGLSATAGDGTVDLAWSPNVEPDVDGYTVYRSTTSGGSYAPLTGSLLANPSYTDSAVSNGTTYYYVVTASDTSANESASSSEEAATPQAPATQDLASADHATPFGSVAGSYLATHTQDDAYQSITEESTDARVNKRYDLLEHIWRFDLTGGNHVFNVDAYYNDAGDGDSGFIFSWATSPSGPWNNLPTVAKTADNDAYQTEDMGSVSGTIYVRAVDNNRSRRQYRNDTLYVDHMYVDGGAPSVPPDAATNPNPADGAAGVNTSPTLSWTAGARTESHNVYFGEGPSPAFQGNQEGTSFSPGPLDLETTYYWRIDEVNGAGTTSGAVWSVTTTSPPDPPDPASNPDPVDGATEVSTSPILGWTAGARAESHDVYFGTNPSPGAGEFIHNQAATSYSPGSLALETTYYWRIDEVNSAGMAAGTPWSFTTMASVESQTMHVDSIVLDRVRTKPPLSIGRATVVVVNDLGDPVSGALVDGTFSGDLNEAASDATGAGGAVVLETTGTAKKPSFTFCVDAITYAGLTYEPDDDMVDCPTYP